MVSTELNTDTRGSIEKSKLAQARIRKHWTLKQAADAVGVSLNTFSRWEFGRQKPYGESLLRLCKVFDASSEQLGSGEEYGHDH